MHHHGNRVSEICVETYVEDPDFAFILFFLQIEPASSDSEMGPWKIQWAPLWSELKSWRNYWNNSEKTDFLENFGTSSVFFASSVYDVSCALVADSYYSKYGFTGHGVSRPGIQN